MTSEELAMMRHLEQQAVLDRVKLEARAQAFRECAAIATKWAQHYPVEIFPEDSPSFDAKWAGFARRTSHHIAEAILKALADEEEPW